MANRSNKMLCPKCGAEMNHHADKLVDLGRPEDAQRMNATLGGVIEEIHFCPACGAVASRREDGGT